MSLLYCGNGVLWLPADAEGNPRGHGQILPYESPDSAIAVPLAVAGDDRAAKGLRADAGEGADDRI